MNPILKNILAVIAGWIGGSIVNMGLIKLGSFLMPINGVDPNDMTSLAAAMPTMEPKYFIFPFLAHAFGTLAGALVAGVIAANHKMKFSMLIGVFFLLAGITVNYMLPGPTWFAITDILLAYIPMAYLGGLIAIRFSKTQKSQE